jgi:tRNA threonylcarbamoyladenosine biosynthesis protein TsaB
MRILAWETADLRGSAAALDDERVLAEVALQPGQRTAQFLVPTLEGLLHTVGWEPRQVELVAVAVGPGSFTGLRIGVTTAKAFAYAVGCPVVGVNTLLAIAAQAPSHVTSLWTVMDAQRGDLVAARVATSGAEPTWQSTPQLFRQADWLTALVPGDVVTGPGLRTLAPSLPPGVAALDETLWLATAATVGRLGAAAYRAGRHEDVFALVPEYYRRPAAEEKWSGKPNAAG